MATTAAKAIKAQIDKETESYRQLQQDVQKNHTARLRFTQQLSESKMVLQELDLLDDEAVVYKLVGPALIRQDLVEAKANVDKRMDFMKKESDRLDSSLKSLENKQLQAQQAVQSLNQKLQKFAPKQPEA
uniref:Prefoldin subunit 6 n=1 Tax=Chloropicon laureae TaxID=464258 RepID=A0A7S3E1B3_9CHLO|eukprot:CAMPEP_0197495952 /NCGR_PEP_ID=MMETSP1311-20131121/40043_1 /TAXON_ID=464262 /ORGANISM="Genus nov. species nov., Strain RCC856" /LENGTH=129 /DNA_ID=CAMNT_0043041495 /DNA_START=23 /DNA_END=412 /DNA_ORIENTATION=-